jgi:thiamine-monophosphate kinase
MVEVLTTDSLVEGVHFRRDWTAPQATGYMALAVNLSDLAAMGAAPRAALLSLALPDDYALQDFDDLIEGFLSLAHSAGAPLVGGNLTRSPGPLVIDVTAIGAARRRRLLRRQGARAGDELYVTGAVGAAAAGLAVLGAGWPAERRSVDVAACVERYDRPEPRSRSGSIVGRTGSATAAIDLSDGLADGVRRLSAAAGLGVVIDGSAVPVHPGAVEWAQTAGVDPLTFGLTGGEDYELLFAVSPRRRRRFLGAAQRVRGLAVTCIGRFVPEDGQWVMHQGTRRPLPQGFTHF